MTLELSIAFSALVTIIISVVQHPYKTQNGWMPQLMPVMFAPVRVRIPEEIVGVTVGEAVGLAVGGAGTALGRTR